MPNSLVKNQEIVLSIKRIGINGEGIGYYKKLAVFVPSVLPGEEVLVRITEVHDQYSKGEFISFKGEPSKDRVKPICPYYNKCGGCQIQHMSYPLQLKTKRYLVEEAFIRYFSKKLNPLMFKETIGMEDPWHYRNKVKLPVRYDGDKIVTGLYEENSNCLVYIDDCLIEKKDIRATIKKICDILTKYQVIAYNPKSRMGVLRNIVIRSSQKTDELQVTLILYKEDERTIKIGKELIKINNVESVYYTINDDLDALENFGGSAVKIIGKDAIEEQIKDLSFDLYPTSFFQLNLEQTKKLYDTIVRIGKFKGYENVLDGFCGVGTIGLYVSKYVNSVKGIDNNKAAIMNAKNNALKNGIKNAEFYYGNLLPHLQQFKNKGWTPDVVILDPPRTGLDLNLIKYLQDNPVKKIIYVSCNPSTLAKNCNHFMKKYHILQIQPLDMFPQTANVECIAYLEKR